MFNNVFEYFFWFSQPTTILTPADKYLGYFFAGLVVLSILIRILVWFSKNPVNQKLMRKFWLLGISTGLSGLVWFGIRYENTPIFGRRYWAGVALGTGVIWFLWVIKYLIWEYRGEKKEFERESIKSKYLPKAR